MTCAHDEPLVNVSRHTLTLPRPWLDGTAYLREVCPRCQTWIKSTKMPATAELVDR